MVFVIHLVADTFDSSSVDDTVNLVVYEGYSFEQLKDAAAHHFGKDPHTVLLYRGSNLLYFPDSFPIDKALYSGETLCVKGPSVVPSSSESSPLDFNGGLSETEALQFALSEHPDSLQAKLLPTAPPLNDLFGRTVCTGSISQYSMDGGSSACTSICLIAAHRLLTSGDITTIRGSDLDEILVAGVEKHSKHGMEQTGISDLWALPTYADLQCSLQLHESCQGFLEGERSAAGYLPALQRALNGTAGLSVAALITKTPETFLCLSTPAGLFLFDSHGQSHEKEKRVYLKEFDSIEELANGLLIKYPFQDFGVDQGFLAEMYNTFDIHPLTIAEEKNEDKAVFEETPFRQAICESEEASNSISREEQNRETTVAVQTSAGESDDGGGKPSAVASLQNSTVEGTRPRYPSLDQSGIFERDDYEDPIFNEIMADPVKCADGYTYERQQIETHFQTRIKLEEDRLAEIEAEQRNELAGQQTETDTTCCGERKQIELTSPLTGEILTSDILVPDKNLERRIVRLVESNALDMTEEEIQSWRELRELKRVKDRQREQELRDLRANKLRMEDEAAQAEKRRQTEAATASSQVDTAIASEKTTANLVRVDRNVRVDGQRLTQNDTGLSVTLCDKGDRIFPNYILAFGQRVRCMVSCCAALMDSIPPSWCARCGRITCRKCLNFGVTDFFSSDSMIMHVVCSECVTQVLDIMDLSDHRVCQARDIIQRINLQQDSARLANEVASIQDHIVRQETSENYRIRLEERQQELRTLQHRRNHLSEQIQRAVDDAKESRRADEIDDEGHAATSDTASSTGRIKCLQQRYEELEKELDGLAEAGPPDDEDAQVQYVIRREEKSAELGSVQAQLFSLLSLPPDQPSSYHQESDEEDASGTSIDDLNFQYTELVEMGPPEDEDAQLSYMLRLSELQNRLEVAQTNRVKALSAQEAAPAINSKEPFSDHAQELLQLTDVDMSTLDEDEQIEHVIRLSELQETARQLEAYKSGGGHAGEDIKTNATTGCTAIPANTKSGTYRDDEESSMARAESQPGFMRLLRDFGDLMSGLLPISSSAADSLEEIDLDECRDRLEAIGKREIEWTLPLGLEYPTQRMEQQLEVLRNTLELRLVESQRRWDREFSQIEEKLVEEIRELEDTVQDLLSEANNAAATAAQERARLDERRRKRALERQRQEQLRREQERLRQERVRRAQQEARELRERHANEDAQARQSFAAARGGRNQASAFGGCGDLRMCGRCKAGPFENRNCSDLRLHNVFETTYKGTAVAGKLKPNHCPNCDWHDPDWNNWPYFDGVFGPH